MTPAPLAGAIIAHYTDRFDGSILDPARGQGAFFGQFPRHLDRHWCELTDGRDFLRWAEPVDWIMTNPPWSRLRDFTRHAMTLAQNIVWLAPIVNLTTKARLRDLDEHGFGVAELLLIDTPKFWPQSGFQLAAAHLKKGHTGAWQVSRLKLLDTAPTFVPLMIEPSTDPAAAAASDDTGVIKVELCGAVLHVTPECSPERAAALAAALRKVL